MKICRSFADIRAAVSDWHRAGESVVFSKSARAADWA